MGQAASTRISIRPQNGHGDGQGSTSLLVLPGRLQRIDDRGSAADGQDADGRVVNVLPFTLREMDRLAHIPLVGEPEDEPKAD